MASKHSSADIPMQRFWHDLSQEFAFTPQDDGQMEQQLQAITETWMICTGELLGLPVQTAPSDKQTRSGYRPYCSGTATE